MTSSPTIEHVDVDQSDLVALANGVEIHDGLVIDTVARREIPLNPTAITAFRLFNGSRSFASATEEFASTYGIPLNQAEADLRALIAHADDMALLRVERPRSTRLNLVYLALRGLEILRLDWRRKPARRYAPTLPALAKACLWSSRWSWIGVALSSVILMSTLLYVESSYDVWRALPFGLVPVTLHGFLVLLLFAHEAGHLVAIRRAHIGAQYVAVRGWRISIAHGSSDRRSSIRIALAGPLAAVATAFFAGSLMLLAGTSMEQALAPLACASIHVYCLMPWTADGRMLFNRPRKGANR